jgi:hypothetical protein
MRHHDIPALRKSLKSMQIDCGAKNANYTSEGQERRPTQMTLIRVALATMVMMTAGTLVVPAQTTPNPAPGSGQQQGQQQGQRKGKKLGKQDGSGPQHTPGTGGGTGAGQRRGRR